MNKYQPITPNVKTCVHCKKSYRKDTTNAKKWARRIYCSKKCDGQAYRMRAFKRRERDKIKREATLGPWKNYADRFLYTYKPETTVCVVRG